MIQTLPIPRRRRGSARRLLAAPVLGLLAAAFMLLAPSLASADSASTLSVIGTSDVSDSGLMANLIQPQFSAAYPQFTFKYTGSATGTAIGNAETGTGGPSVLIVHAASLENQFVGNGFSYNNQYGNAIFRNDFVLAGPTADASHANVGANAANNIAQAFADVAAAGAAGNATFFTRGGGTTAPGTVVAEHQYWQLVNNAGLTPNGVVLCAVSAADGGGMSPINTGTQMFSGQPCPDGGTVTGPADLPAWYKINAGNQAANVLATNACTGAGVTAGGCYSLTDRGTFDYLSSGTDPAGAVPNLKIVTRDNGAFAPGGANALINYFHVYIINPSKPGESVNLPAAQDFVNFLTSPIVQARLSGYLPSVDPGGPPFVADASPTITAAGLPSTVTGGTPVTVTGQVTNNEIGYPAVGGKPVSIDQVKGVTPISVASGTTDATGHFSITFTPASSGSYQVATGAISQIEDATLSPPYGDILSPAASAASSVAVNATAAITKTTTSTPGSVKVSGTLGPAAVDTNAKVTLLARKKSSKGAFKTIATQSQTAGASSFTVTGKLAAGPWTVEVQYTDPGAFNAATSTTKNVTVLSKGPKVSYRKLTVKKGAVTVTGTLGLAPKGSKATVRLFAYVLNRIGHKVKKGKKPPFRSVARTTVKAGKKTFTLTHTFKRGYRYVLKLEYTHGGQKSTNSNARNVVIR